MHHIIKCTILCDPSILFPSYAHMLHITGKNGSTLHFSKHRARKFGLVSCRRRIRPKKRYLIAKKYSQKTQNTDFSSVTFFFPLLADKLGVHLAVTRTQPYSSARAHLYIEQPSFLANQWLSSPQA